MIQTQQKEIEILQQLKSYKFFCSRKLYNDICSTINK
jgi:predicted nucleic acid-binding protein